MGLNKTLHGTERRRGRRSAESYFKRERTALRPKLVGFGPALKLAKRIRSRLANEAEALGSPDRSNRAFRITDATWWASLGRRSRATPAGIRDSTGALVTIPRERASA